LLTSEADSRRDYVGFNRWEQRESCPVGHDRVRVCDMQRTGK